MGKYDAAKSAQLGMPVSTARSRLVKSLLFRELQRSGQDKCFKCGLVIDDIDHLSIEHKEPWLHVSPDLFWDLDNVEFSHMACNKVDRPWLGGQASASVKVEETQRRAISGVAWCSGHQKLVPVESFSKNRYNYNGVQDLCRECRSKYRSRVA